MTTTVDLHEATLEAFGEQRFCSVAAAAKYLGRPKIAVYRLIADQRIASRWQDGRHMVIVSDLIRYADELPVDRPEVA